jgi:hypothetical protein
MELTGGNFSIINKVRIKEERLRREGELVTDNNGLPINKVEELANNETKVKETQAQASIKFFESINNI